MLCLQCLYWLLQLSLSRIFNGAFTWPVFSVAADVGCVYPRYGSTTLLCCCTVRFVGCNWNCICVRQRQS